MQLVSESIVLLELCLLMHTITIPRLMVIKSALNDATPHIKVMARRELPISGAKEERVEWRVIKLFVIFSSKHVRATSCGSSFFLFSAISRTTLQNLLRDPNNYKYALNFGR